MSNPDEDEARHDGFRYAMLFLALGLFSGLGTFYQTYMFNIAGVKLTSRLRTDVFEATMRQEMGWFDESRNGVGILCARLAGDCASVQGVSFAESVTKEDIINMFLMANFRHVALASVPSCRRFLPC